jgi:hypothetical protein
MNTHSQSAIRGTCANIPTDSVKSADDSAG